MLAGAASSILCYALRKRDEFFGRFGKNHSESCRRYARRHLLQADHSAVKNLDYVAHGLDRIKVCASESMRTGELFSERPNIRQRFVFHRRVSRAADDYK